MVGSIQSLQNMEYMLYGNTPGFGSMSTPSMMNNYCMNVNPGYGFNPYMSPYYMSGQYSPSFGQNIPSAYAAQNTYPASNSVFEGLSENEKNALVNDYVKGMDPSESFLGAASGAAAFSVLFHPRAIAHPVKTFKSFGITNKLFDLNNEALLNAWKTPGSNEILRDAYTATNRIDARSLKKNGLHIWRKGFTNPDEYKDVRKLMKKAIDAYKKAPSEETLKGVKEATEALNRANVKNGLLPRAWNWTKNLFRETKVEIPDALTSAKTKPAAEEVAANATGTFGGLFGGSKAATGATEGAAKTAVEGLAKGKTYLETLKTSGGGVKGGLFFLAIEYLTSMGKIKDSFEKDSKTGWTQLGQTTVKGLGSAAGWAAGEALGVWGTTKLLAAAGTAISPGVGTAIGAVAGMIVGSIGCWLAGKVTKKLVGQDVGDKVRAEKMAKTEEGQVQLLQNTATRMQKGEAVDPQAQLALQKLLSQYSVAA